MVSSNQAVKITAKTALKGKWVIAVVTGCIVLFAYLIAANSLSVLSAVIGNVAAEILMVLTLVFIITPLVLGLMRFFWRILFDANDSPISVFYYFSNISVYRRALSLIMSFAFKFIFWGIILSIPSYIVQLISHDFIYDIADMPIPVWTANLSNIAVFLRIIAGVLVCVIMLRFYLAPMLFIADDNIECAEAMHMSSIISKKTSIDFIYLLLSFIGWIILSVTVIPLIFTVPYILTSYLVHARFAVADYNKHIKLSAENVFPSFTV